MDNVPLSKLFYQDRASYLKAYTARFESEYAVKVNFDVKGAPAFFVQTPELFDLLYHILKADKQAAGLCQSLPPIAIEQFSKRCLVDEIVLTNSIEGVRSTRKEISAILDELEVKSKGKRFYGLVKKYAMLTTAEELPLKSCKDVRNIYDELVLKEVSQEEKENVPDGKYFRKGPVSIYSPSQKEIHKGLYPEERIITAMEDALAFLNGDSCNPLFQIGIFHYLLEYIHPFYDGNGRLGRFICSYLLSQTLEPVISYRISYTIKEHIAEYYQAFTVCNDPLQKGDLTPFLQMFLHIIKESVDKLVESLTEKRAKLDLCYEKLSEMPAIVNHGDLMELCFLLVQAALFSEIGVPTAVVLDHIGVARATLDRKLLQIPSELVIKQKYGRTNYYSFNVDLLLSSL